MRATVLLVAMMLIAPGPALAGEPDADVVDHSSDQGVEVEATGFDPGAADAGGGSSSSGSTSGGDEIPIATGISLHNCLPVFDDTGVPVDSVIDSTGDCGAISAPEPGEAQGSASGSLPGPSDLATVAFDEMVALAPSVTIVAAPQIGMTGLPTYLWLDPPPTTISASASVPGLTVEARAVPGSYLWDLGDGSSLRTEGPGRPWSRRAPGDVHHTYERRGRYVVTVTVFWEASWRVDGGPWMALGSFQTSGEREHRVRQMIAILS